MWKGSVVALHVTPVRGEETSVEESLEAVAGRGIKGDYRCDSPEPVSPKRQATLIEWETLEALERDSGFTVEAKEIRRNIVTKGVPLNHLVGEEFEVGGVRMKGIMLCDPCKEIEEKTVKGMRAALENRGGLRAEVLTSGIILPGDAVTPSDSAGRGTR
ncbi:MAG: hypothetical protein QF645_05000 [Planctomycetota bacterium]|jgi:MOSC domain-containing protein YiiM|nr:hypothetical protein [Planctomycetota bacterium]